MIGYYGDFTFTSNDNTLQVPYDFTRKAKGRWSVISPNDGGRPVSVFHGADRGTVSFNMTLHQFLNEKKIQTILDDLVKWTNTGYAQPLVLGTKPYGYNLWIIDDYEEKHREYDADGNVIIATISVTLKEY